jgi:hypothetical protein
MRNVANVLPAAGWLTVIRRHVERERGGAKLPAVRSQGSLGTGRRISGNSLTIQRAVGGPARYGTPTRLAVACTGEAMSTRSADGIGETR